MKLIRIIIPVMLFLTLALGFPLGFVMMNKADMRASAFEIADIDIQDQPVSMADFGLTYLVVSTIVTIGVAWYQSEQQKKAQEAQQQAINNARDEMAPWREAQLAAMKKHGELLEAGPGEYEESPGYQALLEGGTKALDISAASRGKVRGGGHEKALLRYGTGLAKQDYGNFLKRYYDKLNAWAVKAGLEPQSLPSEVNALIGAGQLQGQGYLNQGNIVAQSAQNLGNTWMDYWLINQLQPQGSYGTNAPTYGQIG
ncbi:MAG: hypothetical protein E3J94_07105 [Desulfobacteraceae bacterium]|nr:MAG: hypothetical protein E3J94_07105 [Desulfobacteraceae bacterium]